MKLILKFYWRNVMKFLRLSVLFLALLGVLVPPPALAVAAVPPWYVMAEVVWTVPDGWSDTILEQEIEVEFAVWTAVGPTFGTATAKISDRYAYAWVTIANGAHYGDLFATVAEMPYTQIRIAPPPSENMAWIEEEYAYVWDSGFVNWHSLVLD